MTDPDRFCNILAGLTPAQQVTATILEETVPAAVGKSAWITNQTFIASLARFGPAVKEVVPAWKSAAGAALKRKNYRSVATVLAVIPLDSKYVDAGAFLPLARQALASLSTQGIAGGAEFLKRYGVDKLPEAERKNWLDVLQKALVAKPFPAKLSVVTPLPEFGQGARHLIPDLRKVYLEQGMREAAEAAIKSIDPNAPVVKVQIEPGLDDDSEAGDDLLDL